MIAMAAVVGEDIMRDIVGIYMMQQKGSKIRRREREVR